MAEARPRKNSTAPEQEETHSSEHRYLVLGSTGYAGVDSVEWDVSELPNIVDYDTLIVDVRALNEEKLASVSNKRLETLRVMLTRLLHSKGQIIVVSDFVRNHRRPKEYPDTANNYRWCPIEFGLSKESGESIEFRETHFSGYLKHLTHWPYFFFTPESCLALELTDFYGSPYHTRYKIPCTPFVVNRYGKTIAGSYRIEVTNQEDKASGYETYKHYPKAPHHVTGEIVMLPLIEGLDHKEAVRLVLEGLTGQATSFVPPTWVDAIEVPHVKEINSEIQDKQQKIDAISSEIGKLKTRREALYEYRKLLYASGFDLEEIVKVSLQELGGKVIPAKYGQEEYILEFEGAEYLVEVKGVTKSVSLGHLRQLTDYLLRHEEKTQKACKGILLGNAWRNDPPSERGTAEKPEFPVNVVERANQLGVALVSSALFFNSFCQFLKDRSLGHTILREIVGGVGVITFSVSRNVEN
ncbi:hypothetical protein MYX04_13255 [Nitrospiraceae bacterium AH_259_D15_M11_P09]|nr:hypothetical protein [Nitrospiraceae bacterium AH_259_D15_M11_P09]